MFGEDKLDRKERLRTILSTMPEDEVTRILHSPDEAEQVQQRDTSTWYHKGPAALRDARVEIADFSLKRAQQRLAKVMIALFFGEALFFKALSKNSVPFYKMRVLSSFICSPVI